MITVIGSANMDMVVPVRRLPIAGETLMGGDLLTVFGGKGANQAVAAARLGAEVEFIGKLGHDEFGQRYADHLVRENIGTSMLEFSDTRPTGAAMILVGDRGENQIVVSPGANYDVDTDMISRAEESIADADLLVLQMEIPSPSVLQAVRLARKHNVPVLLNPSPVLGNCYLSGMAVDYMVLNQIEAETLSAITNVGVENTTRVTNALRENGTRNVIMTRGENNTVINEEGSVHYIPTMPIDPIDTVGAGDTFAGALAVGITEGMPLPEAVRFANCAASLATMQTGAQTSMPHRHEVTGHLHSLPA